jgi:hypothetical protein
VIGICSALLQRAAARPINAEEENQYAEEDHDPDPDADNGDFADVFSPVRANAHSFSHRQHIRNGSPAEWPPVQDAVLFDEWVLDSICRRPVSSRNGCVVFDNRSTSTSYTTRLGSNYLYLPNNCGGATSFSLTVSIN